MKTLFVLLRTTVFLQLPEDAIARDLVLGIWIFTLTTLLWCGSSCFYGLLATNIKERRLLRRKTQLQKRKKRLTTRPT